MEQLNLFEKMLNGNKEISTISVPSAVSAGFSKTGEWNSMNLGYIVENSTPYTCTEPFGLIFFS